jgi:tyrosinase
MSVSISTTAQNDGYVVGVQNGKIYPRLDIDEFVLDQDVLNLFVLALIKLQEDASYKQPWSWFQISGIHGRPFTDWDNVGLKNKRGGSSPLAGYCSHSSVTFPTWHRPYVAMMEVYHIITALL